MNKMFKTKPFETIHPMTYWFVVQSIVWGVMILIHLVFERVNFLKIGNLFWPEPITYGWAVLLIAAGLLSLFFFFRDDLHSRKTRIVLSAKFNLILWVFATIVWLSLPGAHVMLIVSILNIIGFGYIDLASLKRNRRYRV